MSLAAVSGLFVGTERLGSFAPDKALITSAFVPNPDFVLCRDNSGAPTAVYKEQVWDFNPYRLSSKKVNKFYFETVFEFIGSEQYSLIDEAKYVIYCLIYFVGGGRAGKLSVGTVVNYWFVIRAAIKFCDRQKEKPAVGSLTLRQLLTTPIYLAAFLEDNKDSCLIARLVSSILRGLILVGEDRLGYRVINSGDLKFDRGSYHQHPVIPTRIYLGMINGLSDLLDQMHVGIGRFESFIAKFDDKYYGLNFSTQSAAGFGGKTYFRPAMIDALEHHGLADVFSGEFLCEHKRYFSSSLLKMQYALKQVIHLYTGMRDQEVLRMPYNCLAEQVYIKESVDDTGVVRDRTRAVSILSTTTKFTGYRKAESWFAPSDVVKAVKIAQAICRGLSKLYKIATGPNCPLFLNPSILKHKGAEVGVGSLTASNVRLAAFKSFVIESSDLQELSQTDTKRDFYHESKFGVGQSWPLTSHQFRRSLAFYASNSGFVSLPSLKSQYKHMTIEMSRYYSNGFENLRTIFGYYDPGRKEFVLPPSHVALEFQMGIPMAVANQLLSDVLFRDAPLFGGTGSYMEKQKTRVEKGEVCVEDVRAETVVQVKSGSISYRDTLLGGCTKVGRCDSFMLGDFTECLSCEGAIIKPELVDDAIQVTTAELAGYADNTGEYQITKGDLERLSYFKARQINRVER
ncbi:integrase [Pseudomonas taetrolens]|uniref:integrase n=1 Tax=Pseudomonas taetrolens TaxID=47884 RepID=UPI003F9B6191